MEVIRISKEVFVVDLEWRDTQTHEDPCIELRYAQLKIQRKKVNFWIKASHVTAARHLSSSSSSASTACLASVREAGRPGGRRAVQSDQAGSVQWGGVAGAGQGAP